MLGTCARTPKLSKGKREVGLCSTAVPERCFLTALSFLQQVPVPSGKINKPFFKKKNGITEYEILHLYIKKGDYCELLSNNPLTLCLTTERTTNVTTQSQLPVVSRCHLTAVSWAHRGLSSAVGRKSERSASTGRQCQEHQAELGSSALSSTLSPLPTPEEALSISARAVCSPISCAEYPSSAPL